MKPTIRAMSLAQRGTLINKSTQIQLVGAPILIPTKQLPKLISTQRLVHLKAVKLTEPSSIPAKTAGVTFQCPKCDFQSSDKKLMKQHVGTVHKMKPFLCFHCEETFSNFKVMKTHIKTCHPEEGSISEPYKIVPEII